MYAVIDAYGYTDAPLRRFVYKLTDSYADAANERNSGWVRKVIIRAAEGMPQEGWFEFATEPARAVGAGDLLGMCGY